MGKAYSLVSELHIAQNVYGLKQAIGQIQSSLNKVGLLKIKTSVSPNLQKSLTDVQNKLSNVRREAIATASSIKSIGSNRGVRRIGGDFRDATRYTKSFADTTYLAARRFSGFIVGAGSGVIMFHKLKNALKEYVTWQEKSVALSQIMSKPLNDKVIVGLQRQIHEQSIRTGNKPLPVYEALSKLVAADVNLSTVRDSVKMFSELSLNAQTESLSDFADIYILFANSLKMNSAQIETNINRLVQSSKKFAVEMPGLTTMVSKSLATWKGSGQGLEELLATYISSRTKTRLQPEVIATSLNAIIQRLGKPENAKMLEERLGVNIYKEDNSGRRSMIDVINELSSAMKGLDARQRDYITSKVIGIRHTKIFNVLTSDTSLMLRAYAESLKNVSVISSDSAIAQQTLNVRFQKSRNSFQLMVNDFAASKGFDTMVSGTIKLSNALMKMTTVVAELAPMMMMLFALKGGGALVGGGMKGLGRMVGGLGSKGVLAGAGAGVLAGSQFPNSVMGSTLSGASLGGGAGFMVGGPWGAALGSAIVGINSFTTALEESTRRQFKLGKMKEGLSPEQFDSELNKVVQGIQSARTTPAGFVQWNREFSDLMSKQRTPERAKSFSQFMERFRKVGSITQSSRVSEAQAYGRDIFGLELKKQLSQIAEKSPDIKSYQSNERVKRLMSIAKNELAMSEESLKAIKNENLATIANGLVEQSGR